jgi:hypothetical protein
MSKEMLSPNSSARAALYRLAFEMDDVLAREIAV